MLEQVSNAIDLDRVQLGPSGDVVVLGVHYQIAQKLHASTEIPAEGTNPRVHDLYDTLLLAGLAEQEGIHRTRAACEDTFTHRNRHTWPPALPDWPDWSLLWNALDVPDNARIDYKEARQRVEQLVADLVVAGLDSNQT